MPAMAQPKIGSLRLRMIGKLVRVFVIPRASVLRSHGGRSMSGAFEGLRPAPGDQNSAMNHSIALENRAQICRVTCGWKLAHLSLDAVLQYWRDVHSPSIARRPGIWEYRHFQFAPVALQPSLAASGIITDCPDDEQLMWTSDVRYEDDDAVATFSATPTPDVRASMLADIDLIVDQSTTYRVIGDNGHTFTDRSVPTPPQGPPPTPAFALFFRRRSSEAEFRDFMTTLAADWAKDAEALRVRLSLFETPDMAAERASGYPIKTHPPERQYQAWIDLAVAGKGTLAGLLDVAGLAAHVATLHVYPLRAVYTSNYAGHPTLVGLRGYPAYQALVGIAGYNQCDPHLLEWMYGEAARGVTFEPAVS